MATPTAETGMERLQVHIGDGVMESKSAELSPRRSPRYVASRSPASAPLGGSSTAQAYPPEALKYAQQLYDTLGACERYAVIHEDDVLDTIEELATEISTKVFEFGAGVDEHKQRTVLYWGELSVEESQVMEFKHKMPLVADVRKYAHAFLNTFGGVLVFGVIDSGAVLGVPFGEEREELFRSQCHSVLVEELGLQSDQYTLCVMTVVVPQLRERPLPPSPVPMLTQSERCAVVSLAIRPHIARNPFQCYFVADDEGKASGVEWLVKLPTSVAAMNTVEQMMAWAAERGQHVTQKQQGVTIPEFVHPARFGMVEFMDGLPTAVPRVARSFSWEGTGIA